jgi:hypothetical protein
MFIIPRFAAPGQFYQYPIGLASVDLPTALHIGAKAHPKDGFCRLNYASLFLTRGN